jgi:hypothetical protein
MNRRRHFPTVAGPICRRPAISLLDAPAAHARINLARIVNAAGKDRERANDSNCASSSEFNFNSDFGRPIGIAVSLLYPILYAMKTYMSRINGTGH